MLNYLNMRVSKGLNLDTLMLYNKKKSFILINKMTINDLNFPTFLTIF